MENKKIMSRLLQRIKVSLFPIIEILINNFLQMTDDGAMHRQLMRMHGFSLMYMVLTELADDKEIVLLVSDEI